MADELDKKNQEIDKKDDNLPKQEDKKPLSKEEAVVLTTPLAAVLVDNTVNTDNTEEEDDPLASFFAEEEKTVNTEPEDDDDPLASFFKEEETVNVVDEDDPLASFFEDEKVNTPVTEEDDLLDSFFADESVQNNNQDEDDPLASFFADEKVSATNNNDDLLDSFFNATDNINKKKTTTVDDTGLFFGGDNLDGNDDDENDYKPFGVIGKVVSASTSKPEPALPYKREKRKARLDITKNSKEDQRTVERYTKKEVEDQLIADYKYMLSKPYMMIQPITIMADYPYKKKKNDSDIINDKNVEYDYVIAFGKQLKWRSTEEFRGKPYKLGEIMYMKRGIYWVDGNEVEMDPHFAIVLHRSYKRIKSKRIRDLFMPLKQRLRSGKPFSIYKEFPMIIKRTAAYS